ncbi:MAG TPA: hypothetical protein IAC83_02855 [Euryarchaeota archaeon]|nr:hypothetical protein [Euryarchaeota archaeon]
MNSRDYNHIASHIDLEHINRNDAHSPIIRNITMKIKEQIRAAYKKTKSYVFYDKNLYHIRDAIAELESEGTDRLEQMLDQLEITIGNGEYIEKFDVDVIATPKKVTALSKKTRDRAPITDNESINAINILSNLPNDYEVSEIQYYIDLPLRWFVLGLSLIHI